MFQSACGIDAGRIAAIRPIDAPNAFQSASGIDAGRMAPGKSRAACHSGFNPLPASMPEECLRIKP